MDLVPVSAPERDERSSSNHTPHTPEHLKKEGSVTVSGRTALTLSPAEIERAGIQLARVERGELQVPLLLAGRVLFDPQGLFTVTSRVSGWVTFLYKSQPGEVVLRGEPLYRLFSPEARGAVEEYRAFHLQEGGGRVVEGEGGKGFGKVSGERVSSLLISPHFLKEVLHAPAVPDEIPFVSPFSGTIVELKVRVGDRVVPDSPLFLLYASHSVIVEADLPLRWELPEGTPIQAVIAPGSSRRITKNLEFLSLHYDEERRVRSLRFRLQNPGRFFLPGEFLEVKLLIPYRDLLLIPDSALIFTGDGYLVYVAEEEGRFVPKRVEVAVRGGGFVGVREGLREGDQVIREGTFLLDADSKLRTLRILSQGGGHAHPGY
jgi:Cu(I)/Ag(I) efflux system membrane fusion protein